MNINGWPICDGVHGLRRDARRVVLGRGAQGNEAVEVELQMQPFMTLAPQIK